MLAADAATSTEREREDFLQQAEVLAESAVARTWKQIEPLTKDGGKVPIFVDLAGLPAEAIGHALNPMPGDPPSEPGEPSEYDAVTRHLVAHAFVASVLTGRSISVGFSGFTIPAGSAKDEEVVVIMQAGSVLDILLGTVGISDSCDCRQRGTDFICKVLGGDWPAEFEGTIDQALRSVGRREEFHDYFVSRWTDTERLVMAGMRTGFIDHEAERLSKAGRIIVDPTEATHVVHELNPDVGAEQLTRPCDDASGRIP